MRSRNNFGVIGQTQTLSGGSAYGIYSASDVYNAKLSNIWPAPVYMEYLVVGGGGSGGRNDGGGGGAGGMLYTSGAVLAKKNQTYTITVGAGGTYLDPRGGNGSNSLLVGLGPATNINSTDYASLFPGSNGTAGTKYFLSVAASSATAMGSGNFTLEGFMYLTGGGSGSSTGTWRTLISTRATSSTSSTTAFAIGVGPEGGIYFYSNGMTVYINTTQNLANAWHHFAFVRNGSTLTAYIDGVSVASGANSDNYTVNTMYIGADGDGNETWEGLLSNIRVTKGVAVYTGNFSVPSIPLTAIQSSSTNISAITSGQCSLLTLQSSTIIDNSSNALTITQTTPLRTMLYSNNYILVNALGGGGGGSGAYGSAWGADGGSGGGAGNGGTRGYARSGQGNNGGAATAVTGSPYYCAGGGGAGAAATDSTGNSVGTYGGIGLQNSITGTAVYYAGGGNGYGYNTAAGGSLNGGGGLPSPTSNWSGDPTSGTANTGGGGGGGGSPAGGNGGSGIVIVKVLTGAITATTGSPIVTTSGGYSIYKFNSSGTITF